jgi:transposase
VDALGNPIAFALSGDQAHDLDGADVLLPNMQADLLIADKAYAADELVVTKLADKNKAVVIPPKANRKIKRAYDRHVYKSRI